MVGDTGPKLFLGMSRFHEPHRMVTGDDRDDGAEVDSTVRTRGIASGPILNDRAGLIFSTGRVSSLASVFGWSGGRGGWR